MVAPGSVLPWLVLTDWRLNEAGVFDAASMGNLREWAGDGHIGNLLTVNGIALPEIAVASGTGWS